MTATGAGGWFDPAAAPRILPNAREHSTMKSFLWRWFGIRWGRRPTPVLPVAPSPTPPAPTTEPYVPMSDAEREANGRAHSAARAAAIAEQVHVNEFQDPPEVCAARAADPAWQEEQRVKREVSSEAWVAYRNEVGMPVVAKAAGERF